MITAILLTMDEEKERDTLEYLYEEYARQMYLEAYKVLGSKEDAEDALHDTFVKLAKVVGTVDTSEKKRTLAYLLTAVRNSSYNLINKRTTELINTEESKDGELPDIQDVDNMPEEIAISRETFDEVVNAIMSLDSKYRDVLYYTVVEEMNAKQIGALLGINHSTVRIRISRGRKLLCSILEERGIKAQ